MTITDCCGCVHISDNFQLLGELYLCFCFPTYPVTNCLPIYLTSVGYLSVSGKRRVSHLAEVSCRDFFFLRHSTIPSLFFSTPDSYSLLMLTALYEVLIPIWVVEWSQPELPVSETFDFSKDTCHMLIVWLISSPFPLILKLFLFRKLFWHR